MNFIISDKINRKKLTLGLSALAVVLAAFCLFFGELFAAPLAAIYAVIVLSDATEKRLPTIGVGAFLTAAAIVMLFFDFYTLALPAAAISGLIIAYFFSHGYSKGELAVYVTLTMLVMLVGSLYLSLADGAGELGIGAVVEYANAAYNLIRDEFIKALNESIATAAPELADAFDEHLAIEVFDMVFSMTPAVFTIISFALSGFALKVFSSVAYKLVKEPAPIAYWRFSTSNIVSYFYVCLFVASFFAGTDGVFGITVNNLFYIFLAVYAYIGYNFALSVIAHKLGIGAATLIVVGGLILLGIFGLEILSVFGVIFTHMNNKFTPKSGENNS